MLRKPLGVMTLIVLVATAVTAIGQTLRTDSQAGMPDSIPIRGMTMEFVEANYGTPVSRRSPVGDPPITRWEYQQFVVYFEYKRVIHTVAKRPNR